MSIAVVVKKGNRACIAADTQSNWGSLIQSERYSENASKIQLVRDSYVAVTGAGAHQLVLRHFFHHHADKVDLAGTDAIFSTWLTLHEHLTDDYHLNADAESNDPYEPSRLTALIANPTGIYIVASWRSVDSIKRFWAIGSGQEFALGAMYGIYDQTDDVEEIARVGVCAGIEFDDGCGGPIDLYSVDLQVPIHQNGNGDSISPHPNGTKISEPVFPS